MKLDSIICVLGWEQRFPLGMEILLQKHEVKTIILISFIDYKSMKGIKENKAIIEKIQAEMVESETEIEKIKKDLIQAGIKIKNIHPTNFGTEIMFFSKLDAIDASEIIGTSKIKNNSVFVG